MSETQLVAAILEALSVEPGVVAWRNNTGRRGRVAFGLGQGSADIIACVSPHGRFVALEAKTAKGRTSAAQLSWSSRVLIHGGAFAVVRSVREARAVIASARDQKAAAAETCQDKSYSVTARR